MSTEVKVARIPKCDFCSNPAVYDGKTIMGPWANMCGSHFSAHGVGLGTGRGQRLILEGEK
jgi:hypothetical protein